MPKFSQPGSDGSIPFALSEWRRGVVYTVRPAMLAPLERGQEYRIMTLVRRRGEAAFGDLYAQAIAFADSRAQEVTCDTPGEPVHAWIGSQLWQRIEAGPRNYTLVGLSSRFLFPRPGQERPPGEARPDAQALLAPGGQMAAGGDITQIGEIFNDFDFEAEPGPGLFSYGEYVDSAEAVDFAPFLQRAERRAEAWNNSLCIIGREWFCATSPDLAVVHLYYELGPSSPAIPFAAQQDSAH